MMDPYAAATNFSNPFALSGRVAEGELFGKGTGGYSPAPSQSAGTQSWWSKLLGDPNSSQRMNMFRAGSAAAGMAEDAMARQKALEEQRMQRAQWLAANANTMAQNRIQTNRGYRGLAALGGE